MLSDLCSVALAVHVIVFVVFLKLFHVSSHLTPSHVFSPKVHLFVPILWLVKYVKGLGYKILISSDTVFVFV